MRSPVPVKIEGTFFLCATRATLFPSSYYLSRHISGMPRAYMIFARAEKGLAVHACVVCSESNTLLLSYRVCAMPGLCGAVVLNKVSINYSAIGAEQ